MIIGVLNKATAWEFFNAAKEDAVKRWSPEDRDKFQALWDECDALFRAAGYGDKCYGWYIG